MSKHNGILLTAAGVLLAAVTAVWAQPTINLFNGTELLNVTTSAGSGAQVTVQTINGIAATRVTATVGFGTLSLGSADEYAIFTGATATGTVNLPNPASNGERIVIANGNNAISGTITVAAPGGGTQTQTLGAGANFASTLAANSSIELIYVWTSTTNPTGTWYRVR
jgi:hypothetical protein